MVISVRTINFGYNIVALVPRSHCQQVYAYYRRSPQGLWKHLRRATGDVVVLHRLMNVSLRRKLTIDDVINAVRQALHALLSWFRRACWS